MYNLAPFDRQRFNLRSESNIISLYTNAVETIGGIFTVTVEIHLETNANEAIAADVALVQGVTLRPKATEQYSAQIMVDGTLYVVTHAAE